MRSLTHASTASVAVGSSVRNRGRSTMATRYTSVCAGWAVRKRRYLHPLFRLRRIRCMHDGSRGSWDKKSAWEYFDCVRGTCIFMG